MPKGVYERNKLKKQEKQLTFSAKTASEFWRIKAEIGRKLPFEPTNKQVFDMLIQHYEKTEGGA